jgi:hypothetical protein
MTVRDMETALQDVELDCAFSIYYFVGCPDGELNKYAQEGVIGWAKAKWPGLMALMIEGVTHVVRTTLEQIDAQPVELPGGELTEEECEQALCSLEAKGLVARVDRRDWAKPIDWTPTPLPPPESGVEWEQPSLNNPDGSEDFELEP